MRFPYGFAFSVSLAFAILALFGCSGTPIRGAACSGDLSAREADSTFILLGDTQRTNFWELVFFREQNDDIRTKLFEQIARENPGFILLLGDLVSQGDDHRDWTVFDSLTVQIRKHRIPMFALLGNHDYFGDTEAALANFFERFPHQRRRLWNSIRFNGVAFILLNSNLAQMSARQIEEQNRWYQDELASAQADSSVTAIVVACHHPPFTNSMIVSCDNDVRRDFVGPYMETPKAKLFFSGHCHSYEHFVEGGKQFIVSGGGGGPRQPVDCDVKRRRFADLYDGEQLRAFHYCRVTVRPEGLHVEMVKFDAARDAWDVGDEFEVSNQKVEVAAMQH